MKRYLTIAGLFFMLIMPQAFGATSQYPNPNRQTMWNNMTDGIHTIGQTPQQAQQTKNRLHNQRRLARIKSINQADHAKFVAQRQAWIKAQNNQ